MNPKTGAAPGRFPVHDPGDSKANGYVPPERRNIMKKLISTILTLALIFAVNTTAFASEANKALPAAESVETTEVFFGNTDAVWFFRRNAVNILADKLLESGTEKLYGRSTSRWKALVVYELLLSSQW